MVPKPLAQTGRMVPLILSVAWMFALPGVSSEPVRSVILVRHAERAGGMSGDAGLSEAGRCRRRPEEGDGGHAALCGLRALGPALDRQQLPLCCAKRGVNCL
jgi:hypothetical protein